MPLSRNIFTYAPKELSHSAFWAWVLDCTDAADNDLAGPRAVAHELLSALDVHEVGEPVDVDTEMLFGKRCRADIRVQFSEGRQLLIECKRSAPVRAQQIERYREELPTVHRSV